MITKHLTVMFVSSYISEQTSESILFSKTDLKMISDDIVEKQPTVDEDPATDAQDYEQTDLSILE